MNLRNIVLILITLASFNLVKGQNHNPKLPPISKDITLNDYASSHQGFWGAVQLSGASSVILEASNSPMSEIDIVGGYRFSSYFKIGLGLGGRYYFNNTNIRSKSFHMSLPLYLNVRGNFINDEYRTVVPYYSADLGAAIGDGVMWRPTLGIRIGQDRSAFLMGISYLGQSLKYRNGKDKYVSFIGLTLGYEY